MEEDMASRGCGSGHSADAGSLPALAGIDKTQFTVVFEGDISKLPFNPLRMHDTPFGRVIGCGYGNAFAELMEREVGAPPLQQEG